MTADHGTACQSGAGKSARVLAAFVVLVFPVGWPLALLVLLFKNRKQIRLRDARSGESELGHIGETLDDSDSR